MKQTAVYSRIVLITIGEQSTRMILGGSVQRDFEAMLAPARGKRLLAIARPRPLVRVTTGGARGAANAAPFSVFNVLGNDPATVTICIGRKGRTRDHNSF